VRKLGQEWLATPASAIKAFKDQFETKYARPADGDSEEVLKSKALLSKEAEKAKCNICHIGTASQRKQRNAYGVKLSELLDRKKDMKDVEKIGKALETVSKERSDPKDEKSPTFGELITQGKLPVPLPKEEDDK
jgi:hypothetical protein